MNTIKQYITIIITYNTYMYLIFLFKTISVYRSISYLVVYEVELLLFK